MIATRPYVPLFPLLLLFCGGPTCRGATLLEYFTVRQGTLPVIITAPHGGHSIVPELSDHDASVSDFKTDLLAAELSDLLEQSLGGSPYLVIAHVPRSQIDFNRARELADDDPAAQEYYDYYHGQIRDFVD